MKYRMYFAGLAVTAAVLIGCNKAPTEVAAGKNDATSAEHNHEGWWCTEHGVPEDVCAQCHETIAADFKAKGDWCKEHNRPESQCFICHPENAGKYVALYEAKFGTKPPKPTAE